jgi:hypothetical protein
MTKAVCTITLVCNTCTILEQATRNFVPESFEHCLELTGTHAPQLLTPVLILRLVLFQQEEIAGQVHIDLASHAL